ncbi:MAG: hypothetical protein ACI4QX_01910, partial [Lachnospiraceae bacterium]
MKNNLKPEKVSFGACKPWMAPFLSNRKLRPIRQKKRSAKDAHSRACDSPYKHWNLIKIPLSLLHSQKKENTIGAEEKRGSSNKVFLPGEQEERWNE